MQDAVPQGKGTMAAILGLEAASVEVACQEASTEGVVAPANFNAPDQTVIAGENAAVQKAGEIARHKGARRVMPLPVSAPFHCALMAPARDRLANDLDGQEFRDLAIPLIANVDAGEVKNGAAARDALVRQVCSPVRWVECILALLQRGVDIFVEVGPGKVLSGLVRKIAPQAQVHSADGIRGIEALASVFLNGKM